MADLIKTAFEKRSICMDTVFHFRHHFSYELVVVLILPLVQYYLSLDC
jgi:hypothetical protein